jgi:hypothetical protein
VPDLALADLAPKLRLDRAPELMRALDKQGIRTLDDVRKTGGLDKVAGLPVARDNPAVKALEAHAQLAVISPDPDLNAKLIDKGYASIHAIASTARSEFIKNRDPAVDETEAELLHDKAVRTEAFLGYVLTGLRVDVANGRRFGRTDKKQPPPPKGGILEAPPKQPTPPKEPTPPETGKLLPEKCECRDCESAVSPLAYLANLVHYALDGNLLNNGNAIDLKFLVDTFHQPFSELTARCDEVEDRELQVRLCIEVLRRYIRAHANDPVISNGRAKLEQAEEHYRKRAYFALLGEIGTSNEELRLTRPASPQERQSLADRLGIAADHLDELILDVYPSPPTGAPTSGRPALRALTESVLEDLFGLVETTVTRDPLRSGPSPKLKTWRLEYLRTVWWRQDWPTDPYAEDYEPEDERLPIIDPDLIGFDDFRNPVLKANPADPDRAFDLWEKRRQWVADSMEFLLWQQKIVDGESKPDLDGMLKQMFVLGPAYGSGSPPTPGYTSIPQWDLDALREVLVQGDTQEVADALERLKSDFMLGVDAFDRLVTLRDKDRLAESDARLPKLSPDEWWEVASILVGSRKRGLFLLWREQERAAAVAFPEEFWISLRQPTVGPWPPMPSPRPLIDPQLQQITDLAEPTIGRAAIGLWQNRQKQLADMERDLKALRRTEGLAGMLRQALGFPLPHDLDALARDLDDPDRSIPGTPAARAAEAAETAILDGLHMSIEAFRQLMDVRAREQGELGGGRASMNGRMSLPFW